MIDTSGNKFIKLTMISNHKAVVSLKEFHTLKNKKNFSLSLMIPDTWLSNS